MIDIERICIIGLGLMGGSFALALKNKGFRGTIVGYDISANYLAEALSAGAIDLAADNLKDAVTDVDLVLLAKPT